jgi:hypothetical protein
MVGGEEIVQVGREDGAIASSRHVRVQTILKGNIPGKRSISLRNHEIFE